MPNHTTTEIVLTSKPRILADFVRKYIVRDGNTCYLDFNKVIPEPNEIEECDPRFVMLDAKDAEERHIRWDENDPKRWFDWYNWRLKNWGTKWNSYDGTCPTPEEIEEQGLNQISIWLYTAWSPAMPVYKKLQETNDNILIDIYYVDEGMFFVGRLWYNGTDECYYSEDFETKEAKEICERLGVAPYFDDEDDYDAEA